jgi:hypothetical protein
MFAVNTFHHDESQAWIDPGNEARFSK